MPICPSCEAEVAEGAKFCTFCGAIVPKTKAVEEDPLIGRIFAKNFRIESLLGVGGMGKVYKAVQISLDKPVVLKLLHPHYADDETLVHRFHREARAASRLNHPNSINIIDFGQDDDGTLFMAMEFLAGRDLFTVLQEEDPLGEARIANIVRQVCSALAEAHEQGVIHRDLKPENIMVEDRRVQHDYVKVLDFGIAKIQDPGGKETRALTAQGMVCGTPEYMAPEQARGDDLDPRTDIYALGVLLYQLSTGQLPFQADNAIGLVTKHIVEAPTPPSEAYPQRNVSPALEHIIMKCLSKKADDRYNTVLELAQELEPLAMSAMSTSEFGPSTTGPMASPRSTGPNAPAVNPATTEPVARLEKSGNKNVLVLGGAAVLALVLIGAAVFLRGNNATGQTGQSPTQLVDAAVAVVQANPDAGQASDQAPDASASQVAANNPQVDASVAAADPDRPKNNGGEANQNKLSASAAKHLKSLLQKGNARAEAGDYEASLAFYQKALAIDSKHAVTYQKIGMAEFNLQHKAKACKALRKYMRLSPKPEKSYRGFVKSYCK